MSKRKPTEWEACEECRVKGPDVKAGSCDPCRGLVFKEMKKPVKYWNARWYHHEAFARFKRAEQALKDAREDEEDEREAFSQAAECVVEEEMKLSGGQTRDMKKNKRTV